MDSAQGIITKDERFILVFAEKLYLGYSTLKRTQAVSYDDYMKVPLVDGPVRKKLLIVLVFVPMTIVPPFSKVSEIMLSIEKTICFLVRDTAMLLNSLFDLGLSPVFFFLFFC